MSPHVLTNFEIQKHYQNKSKFNGAYLRNTLSKTKDELFIKNLNEYESIGTHWIAFYVNDNNVIYFDSVVTGNIPEEIKKSIGNKNIITNIYRIKGYNSNNLQILFYWIYWLYAKKQRFLLTIMKRMAK